MSEAPDIDALRVDLVAHALDAIVIADRQGTVLSWNAGAESMFGYLESEAVGASLDLIVPERFRDRHWAGYQSTMRTGETSYADRVLAVPATHKDGRRLSIEFRVTLLFGSDEKRPIAIGAVIRDVTDHFQEDRALRGRLAELEARNSGASVAESRL